MLKSRYFVPSFFILILVGVLHWVASVYGYYWTVDWYDILMHFLGGAWVALFALWMSDSVPGLGLGRFVNLRNVLLVTLAVGLAWEFFELIMGWTSFDMLNYWSDTITDLIMDTLGALFVSVFSKIYVK